MQERKQRKAHNPAAAIYSTSMRDAPAIPIYEAIKSGEIVKDNGDIQLASNSKIVSAMGENLPMNMTDLIKWAASSYHLSSDVKDYAIVPVPIMISDVPNRNGVAFPREALAAFSPTLGKPFFKSWIGKPTHEEHDNKDIRKAKGLVLDVVMNRVRGFDGYWKVMALLAFDRTKDAQLYNKIVSGAGNAYSMGAYVGYYTCSICGSSYKPGGRPSCSHIKKDDPRLYTVGDKLAYKEVWEPEGFEVSFVQIPAFVMATSDFVSRVDR